MAQTIICKCSGKRGSALGYAPFPTPLGERIAREITVESWNEWLKHQTKLINHYGLDLGNPEAQEFLIDNMQAFLFNEGKSAQIDTSEEGSVNW
ncbi:MAG: oxidative damage protection protein [Pyrinomonadaceae bacterium]